MAQLHIDEAQARETAYFLWLDEGQPQGRDQDHWLTAVNALTTPQPKVKKPAKTAPKPRAAKTKASPKTTGKPATKARVSAKSAKKAKA